MMYGVCVCGEGGLRLVSALRCSVKTVHACP